MRETHSFLYDKELPSTPKRALIIKHFPLSIPPHLSATKKLAYYHLYHSGSNSGYISRIFIMATFIVIIRKNY